VLGDRTECRYLPAVSAISLHPSTERTDRSLEWSLFLLVALCTWHSCWVLNHNEPYDLLRKASDSLAYYQYLPAVFMGDGLERMPWAHLLENGKSISLVTAGVAILELPFFFLGHWWANLFGYNLDGYSPPYAVANMLCSGVYAGAGCVFAFRLARRYSDEVSAALAVVLLFGATNMFYYTAYEPGYSHVYSFFLIAWVCWSGLRVMDGAGGGSVLAFVFGASMLVLVRQLNGFALLFPVLVAVGSPGGLRAFMRRILAQRMALVVALVLALVPWVLQMMYWHLITGDLFTFAYGKKGEHFEWDKMVPGMVLFSERNGWLVYSPLLIPVLVTMLTHGWRRERVALVITLIVLCTVLVYSAWWCWWLGSSFGARGMVDHYALLAIPMAWMVRAARRTWASRVGLGLAAIACIQLNFAMMEHYTWLWSWHTWTWQKYFFEVSRIAVGAD
jgi:hypothetical protein